MGSVVEYTDALFEQLTQPTDPVWEENPADFETFIRSERHLGLPPLSRIQKRDLSAILGEDPKKVFAGGSSVNVGVLMWGKGSGKDYVTSATQCYGIHILHCMRNPSAYYKLASRQWIDCLNTAPSKGTTIDVYFQFFEQMILQWPWLRERYTMLDERGRLLDISGNKNGNVPLKISKGGLEFKEKKIRAICKGSDSDFSEGFAPILWTMDECAAFKDHTETMNADKLYKTLRTSARTRYGMNWKGFLISFPREKGDFICRMYDMAVKKGADDLNATMYGSREATWDVRPEGTYSPETFDFEGIHNIPIDFKEDFVDFPEEAKKMLACIPPEVEAAFFSYPARVLECIHPNRKPLFITEDIEVEHILKDGVIKKYTGKKILQFFDRAMATRKLSYVIHVDGGLTRDHATLIMAHGEPMEIKVKDDEGKIVSTFRYKVIVDLALRWRPDKKKGLQVSLNNVESMIIQIAEVYNVVKVSYDQWNSQSSLEMLQSKNIAAEEHTINDKDYTELRTMVYQSAVDLLPPVYGFDGNDYENKDAGLLYHELITLKNINGRVNHSKTGSKDGADGLAGVNRLLNHPKEAQGIRRRMPKSILGTAFTRATTMPFSPAQAGITQPVPDGFGVPKSPTSMTGQIVPGYAAVARSSKQNDGVVPNHDEVRGYGRMIPRSILSSNGGPMATTKGMSTMMNRARMDVPSYHYK